MKFPFFSLFSCTVLLAKITSATWVQMECWCFSLLYLDSKTSLQLVHAKDMIEGRIGKGGKIDEWLPGIYTLFKTQFETQLRTMDSEKWILNFNLKKKAIH